jgi:hypothetical protein
LKQASGEGPLASARGDKKGLGVTKKGAGEENTLIMYAVISNIKFKKKFKKFHEGRGL